MPNPTKPEIDFSYTGWQQEQQNAPFPGTNLDADLAELKRGIDDTIDALADVRRSDGALRNGIVTRDSLGFDIATIGGAMNPAIYDPNGVAADAFDMANMVEADDAKILTAAEREKLANLDQYVQLSFKRFEVTDEVQSLDTEIDDLNPTAVLLFIDGDFQDPNTFTVVGSVITPVGVWFDENEQPAGVKIDVLGAPAMSSPISAELLAILATKAPLASPALTGNPTAPTQASDNSSTRLATTAFVQGHQIARPGILPSFRKSLDLTPQEYGANGNGTDDTAALAAWAAACQADGLKPRVPAGVYLCSQQLDFSGGGAIEGDGEGRTIIRFTNASSGGFKCHPDGGSDPFNVFSISKMDLQASAVIAKAVDLVLPNDGDFTNPYRALFERLDIYGSGAGYFSTGMFERNVAFAERRRVKYWGSAANPTAESGYYAGVGFDLDTQVVSDDPAYGLSLENLYHGCAAQFCHTGLRMRGFPEGTYISHCNFPFVRRGIDAAAETGTRQPLLHVMSSHFNAAEWAILCDRFPQSVIALNHIARPTDNFGFGWVGVDVDDSLNVQIRDNIIVAETVHPSATGDVVGVRLAGDSYYARVSGAFIGAISGSYKPMTAAVRVQTGVQGTKIDATNSYTGVVTEVFDDNSGNNTNRISGVTVQIGGVTVGEAAGTSLINFGSGLAGSGSGGAVTITG